MGLCQGLRQEMMVAYPGVGAVGLAGKDGDLGNSEDVTSVGFGDGADMEERGATEIA